MFITLYILLPNIILIYVRILNGNLLTIFLGDKGLLIGGEGPGSLELQGKVEYR